MGMIITRRPGESIEIGEARVTVVRLQNGRVKLSVEAPREVRIQIAGRGAYPPSQDAVSRDGVVE